MWHEMNLRERLSVTLLGVITIMGVIVACTAGNPWLITGATLVTIPTGTLTISLLTWDQICRFIDQQ